MKFAFFTNIISPHQMPLARELVNLLGADEYRYVYTEAEEKGRADLGWGADESEKEYWQKLGWLDKGRPWK